MSGVITLTAFTRFWRLSKDFDEGFVSKSSVVYKFPVDRNSEYILYLRDQTLLRLMDKILQRTLNYGNYGIFLIMGHAGFCPSTVAIKGSNLRSHNKETILFTVDPYGFPYGIKPCYCVGFGVMGTSRNAIPCNLPGAAGILGF